MVAAHIRLPRTSSAEPYAGVLGLVGRACFRTLAAALTTGFVATAGLCAPDNVDVQQGLTDFRQGQFAEAFQDWRLSFEAGDPRGALYVGVLYDSGLGVGQDYHQAMGWYRRAAEAGSAAAAFNVGVLYDAGLGVEKDPSEAALWYARAAAKGFGRAEYDLALLYDAGTGVPRNRQRAVSLYELAAKHGIAAARAHLAALGQPFSGLTESPQDTAMQDFEKAQQVLLTRGTAEAERVAALFRRSAEQHNPLAEYDLGYCYERGIGVPRDPVQADDWYRRAANDATDDSLRQTAQLSVRNLESRIGQLQPRGDMPTPPLRPSPNAAIASHRNN
jgi:TPR repeat protein